jgi:integrase
MLFDWSLYMPTYPFSLFKRADRPCFLVSFKDENGKYLPPLSTKMKDEQEALKIAFQWLQDGVPKKQNTVKVHSLSLRETVKSLKDNEEAQTMITELKRQGWLKSFVINNTPQAEEFIQFLSNFWNWDNSPYIKEKLRKAHSIHRRHCKMQSQSITLYWKPFFQGRYIGEITAKDIDNFIEYMGEKSLSSSRKNVVIKAGLKPLRWAYSKGIIEQDPTRGHIMFSGEQHKRNILTPSTATAIFNTEWIDERAKLANMLSAVTGMRMGEILALRYQDLGPDCIFVNGAWNNEDKIKLPKNNETRTVEIPFPSLMNALFSLAEQNPWGVNPDSFVFWAVTKKDSPMQGSRLFIGGLRKALIQIGYTEHEAKKVTFHGWRHFFTSYMIKKLDKKLLKGETGHKTDIMLALYSDHETEGDRQLIQSTKKETFAGLLPERPKLVTFKKMGNKIACCG